VIKGDWKLIRYNKEKPDYALYHLKTDKEESINRWNDNCAVSIELRDYLNHKAQGESLPIVNKPCPYTSPAPILSVDWQPSTVTLGGTSQVHVNAENVSYCRGDDGGRRGTSWISHPALESQNRTVTICCFDSQDNDVISKNATLTVNKPKPALNVRWQANMINRGDPAYVHVNAYNVEYCRGDGGLKKGTSWVTGPVHEPQSRTINIRCF